MALKIKLGNITTKYLNRITGMKGNEDSLYLKITQISGNAEHCCINVSCFAYDSTQMEDSADKRNPDFCINNTTYCFQPELEGDNFIKQGYDYLKTLHEFDGCIDC